MKFGVVVLPGSNCDHDALHVTKDVLGENAELLWHKDTDLKGADCVILPGGFAYGDYLRAGVIARFSPVMRAVSAFAAEGGLVLGICNGFQILCEGGLLPGTLRPNASLSFICRDVELRVERVDTPFTALCSQGQRLTIPIKHGEGCWFAGEELVGELESRGQIVLRYEENPNGSVADVAAIVNEHRNVMGLMPHPEHAVDPLIGSDDGAVILGSLVAAARGQAPAFV